MGPGPTFRLERARHPAAPATYFPTYGRRSDRTAACEDHPVAREERTGPLPTGANSFHIPGEGKGLSFMRNAVKKTAVFGTSHYARGSLYALYNSLYTHNLYFYI